MSKLKINYALINYIYVTLFFFVRTSYYLNKIARHKNMDKNQKEKKKNFVCVCILNL